MTFTPEQFDKLATKDDLKNFATKDDLKNFVTKTEFKEEISKLATKNEFAELKKEVSETKENVNLLFEKVEVLSVLVLSHDDKLNKLEEKSDIIIENISHLQTAIDGLVCEHKSQQLEFTSNISAHDRFETRITKIEKHLDLKPSPGY